jgi:hypothetical protein
MNGSVNNLNGNPLNNLNGNPGTMSFADIILGNTTSPVTNVVFTWFKGNSNGDSPWGNGRTYIFAVSGSSDGGTTYNPVTVTGYDHDGVVEATAPATQGTGSAAYTGVLTNNGTYCNFTMDNGINPLLRGLSKFRPASGGFDHHQRDEAFDSIHHAFDLRRQLRHLPRTEQPQRHHHVRLADVRQQPRLSLRRRQRWTESPRRDCIPGR